MTQNRLMKFFVEVTETLSRPKAVLQLSVPVINCFFQAVDRMSPIDKNVQDLIQGLVKSQTTQPLKRNSC